VNSTTLSTARAVGVVLFSATLFGQANFGRILGTVTDQSGGVVPGATVSITDTQRGLARTLTTDAAGEYNAPTLIPGTYTVRVEAKGFKALDRQNVVIEVGKEVRIDLTPEPGEQTQTVTVTEQISLVDAATPTLGGTLSNAEINDLPLNGRNYQNLSFKALVTHAGVFDLASEARETEELWFPLWEFRGMPSDNPQIYAAWSPSSFVKQFKTPTLVFHGELDYRVPVGQGLQLFTALQLQKVPSKLVLFPDEGHWVLKPQNSVLWYHTFLDWIGEWLKKP
jgi:hypothetical protein